MSGISEFFRKYKPGVSRRTLLLIAAVAWAFSGIELGLKGIPLLSAISPYRQILYIFTGITAGEFFYLLLFANISRKYTLRIFELEVERPCAFSFFSIKGYIMMCSMIALGVTVRKAEILDNAIVGSFYLCMGVPLFLSAWRFLFYGLFYKRKSREDWIAYLRVRMGKHPIKSRLYIFARYIFYGWLAVSVFVIFCNFRVIWVSSHYIHNNIADMPDNSAGLVLGTSHSNGHGSENLYFKYRINAAVELYKAGKIKYIIVSGDNGSLNYNEPIYMKNELVKLGVRDSVIYLDYAGFRTLDSVVRGWEIFSQNRFTVISQEFQNERAICIARYYGKEVNGYNAKDVSKRVGFKTHTREMFARVKVFIDLFIIMKQPKYLGEKVKVG